MLVTVLGASGLIGSTVAAALAERPIRLRLVSRRPSAVPAGGRRSRYGRRSQRPGRMAEVTAGSHAVVHLVALVPEGGTWRAAGKGGNEIQDDLGITRDLIEALRRGRRSDRLPTTLFAGSTSQVGLPGRKFIDRTEPDRPVTPYDVRKLAAEKALKAATTEGALRGITLRLPTVFGHAPSLASPARGVVAAMARRALAGEPATPLGPPPTTSVSRSWLITSPPRPARSTASPCASVARRPRGHGGGRVARCCRVSPPPRCRPGVLNERHGRGSP
ncbi:NAD-dependent epimerase/dehydratase family protein [Salinispora sp. H7-4]|nr:NAD-dependent epimerase/dehydratase family protein [Salinispora sp. H7-4]